MNNLFLTRLLNFIRLIIVFFGIFFSGNLFAQQLTPSTRGENFIKQIEGKLDKAKLQVDKICSGINGSSSAENWFLKGYVYNELSKSEVFKKTAPEADIESLNAIDKCKKLDIENKFVSDCINVLFELSTNFYNKGITSYNSALKSGQQAEFQNGLKMFENFFHAINLLGNDQAIINHLIEINNINKNSVIVYTGYCAQKSGDTDKAKQYYSQLILLNEPAEKAKKSGSPLAYIYYSEALLHSGDSALAKKVIDKGAKIYIDDPDVIMTAVDINSKLNKVHELSEFLELAVNSNSGNAKLLVVLAGAYNNVSKSYAKSGYKSTSMEYRDKSIKTYEKALNLNPNDKQLLFNINYNLGIHYYNPAVQAYKIRNETNLTEHEHLFKKCIPYLESAHKINPSNKNVMTMLMKAYQSLNETAKAESIEKELYK